MQFSLLPAETRLGLCGLVAFAACLANTANAGLSGPSPSYVQPTADGKHMLVMISRVPIADDSGNECTLPDGQKVKLRRAFPSGGLYEIGSTTPVWKADWYGEESNHLPLPHDVRQVVLQVPYAPLLRLMRTVPIMDFPGASSYLDAWDD